MNGKLVYLAAAASLALAGAANAAPPTKFDTLSPMAAPKGGVAGSEASTGEIRAAIDAGAHASVRTGFAAGTTVKDSRGATVGRIIRFIDGPGFADRVVLRMGKEQFTVPTSNLSLKGRYAIANASKAQLRAQSRQ